MSSFLPPVVLENDYVKLLLPYFTYYHIFLFIGFLFVREHYKILPFMYHLRVIGTMIQALLSSRLNTPLIPVRSTHRVHLSDMDWNMHQNNSIYALEIDIQRYLWFIRLMNGNVRNYYLRQGLIIANGGVNTYFLKEMKYGTKYTIETKVIAIDKKWFYLESRFLTGKTLSTVHAISLTRIVFKATKKTKDTVSNMSVSGTKGGGAGKGMTITPEQVLTDLGYRKEDIQSIPKWITTDEDLSTPKVAGGTNTSSSISSPNSSSSTSSLLITANTIERKPHFIPEYMTNILECMEPGASNPVRTTSSSGSSSSSSKGGENKKGR